MELCFKAWHTFKWRLNLGKTLKIRKRVGVSHGGVSIRGPIVQEGFLEIGHIVQKYILVNHHNLRNWLKDQALHLIGIRVRFISKTTYMKILGRPNLLHLMVRKIWSRSWGLDSWDEEVFPCPILLIKYEGKSCYIQSDGRALIRWDHLKQVKRINERKIMWRQLKQKHLSDRYYDGKRKEFH